MSSIIDWDSPESIEPPTKMTMASWKKPLRP